MKIAIFCLAFSRGKGGMEKTAKNIAEYFSNLRHDVSIISIMREFYEGYELSNSVNLIELPSDSSINYFFYKDIIRKIAPDIAIVFSASSQISLTCLLLDELKIPFLIHEASNPQRVINNWTSIYSEDNNFSSIEREVVYSAATRIRFTLEQYKESLPIMLKKHSYAFPNFFPLFQNINKNEYLSRKRIINIGGLKKNKNLRPLLDAFALISKDFPEWQLVIFSTSLKHYNGETSFSKNILNYISKLNLPNQIIVYPPTSKIDDEYEKSAIHVISSLSEGLPNSLIESMTHALPSIGIASCFGVNSLITDQKNGLLIEDDNIVINIADALIKLMLDDELRYKLGQNAYFDSLNQFDEKKILPYWEKIINELYSYKGTNKLEEEYLLINSDLALYYKRLRKKFLEKLKRDSLGFSFLNANQLDKLNKISTIFSNDNSIKEYFS